MIIKNSIPIIIIFFLSITSTFSYAIELNPTDEKIQDALKLGSSRTMDIFGTEQIKPSRFGKWPSGDGGIVESKLVYLAIKSSMRLRAGMPAVSKEEVDAIMDLEEMPIRISSSQKVFNVQLKQKGKTIEPSRIEEAMQMPPGGGAGGGIQSKKVYFKYSELDPYAKTKIILFEDFGEIEFDIDFAKFD